MYPDKKSFISINRPSLNLDIFKKYDIRGKWNTDFTKNNLWSVVSSVFGYFNLIGEGQKKIYIGKDTRFSGGLIKNVFFTVGQDLGVEVVNLGYVTTPFLNFAYQFDEAAACRAMVTASHNSWEYNGIKLFHKNNALFGDQIAAIKKIAKHSLNKELKLHEIEKMPEEINPHETDFFKNLFGFYYEKSFKRFESLENKNTLVFDCMHGSASFILDKIIKKLGLQDQSIILRDRIICNDACESCFLPSPDPTNIKNFDFTLKFLKKNKLPFALAFDGDADRFTIVLSNGRIILGDEILAFFLSYSEPSKQKTAIVTDVVASSLLDVLAEQKNLVIIRSPVGIFNVKKLMDEHNALIGGETSSHFIFYDHGPKVDDGIYTAFRFLETLAKNNVNLSEWLESIPKFFVSPITKFFIKNFEMAEQHIHFMDKYYSAKGFTCTSVEDGFKAFKSPFDWVLIRRSNTEPCLSTRIQGLTPSSMQNLQEELISLVNAL